ncbi:MAG: ComF family protein [Anaerolineae bacterium]
MTTPVYAEASSRSSRGWLAALGDAIADLLFPPHCVVCNQYGAWLCSECQAQIDAVRPPICQRCGYPLSPANLSPAGTSNCPHCPKAAPHLAGLRSFGLHDGPLRKAIHQFKYQHVQTLAVPLGEMMGLGWQVLCPPGLEIDVIVPVPLHTNRQRQRGFNQAAVLARQLGFQLDIPVFDNTLRRTRATAPQVDLSLAEREKNVHGAFQATGRTLSGQCLMLVDDVCTTGSTLEAAAYALREGGVQTVWAYTLARAKGNLRPSRG